MVYSIKQIRELSDEKLIAEHDKKAKNTFVGTKYYMEELDRRSRDRNDKAMFKLTVISAITSILAVVVSVIAVFN
jgi:hypothetical protein